MAACRIFIVTRERISDRLCFDFIGPGLVVAVSVPQHTEDLQDVEAALASGRIRFARVFSRDFKSGATQAVQLLQNRIREVPLAVMCSDERLKDLSFEVERGARPPLVISVNTRERTWAERVAEFVGDTEYKVFRLENIDAPVESPDIKAHQTFVEKNGQRGVYHEAPELEAATKEYRRPRKLLLHICCGPDAAGVVEQLKSEFDLVCFWYDPNVQPREEHDLRLAAFEKVASLEDVPYVVGEYDVERFEDAIHGLEHTPETGAKCSVCYDLRLERAAVEAKRLNCDLFTTTLAISPHKVQQKLKSFGELAAKRHGVPYMARNFLKHDGFKDSVEYTKTHNIYRQDYCGCFSSMTEGGPDARSKASAYQDIANDLS